MPKLSHVVEVEARATPWAALWWDDHRYGAVRIWKLHDPVFRRWWQCHEWERKSGNREREAERWIPSSPGWGAAVEPPEGDNPPALVIR